MDTLVLLLGAHTLGHVHVDMSGYGFIDKNNNNSSSSNVDVLTANAWDNTPDVFDNRYYRITVNKVLYSNKHHD
jgi:hypothetical protein